MSPLENPNSFPYLADDLIIRILTKLPVESLQRFMILSNQWCSNIKDPNFIKSHINQTSSNINYQNLLLFSSKLTSSPCLSYNESAINIDSTNVSSLSVDSQVVSLPQPTILFSQADSYPSVSSCNGLLCMVYSFSIFIWNPVTLKYKSVEKPNAYLLRHTNRYESAFYGFTYDSGSDDYKILATIVIDAKASRYVVGLYSVNNQFWKRIGRIPADYRLLDHHNPISVDGTINMLAIRNGDTTFKKFAIVTFTVVEEKLLVTPIPSQFCGSHMKLSGFANRLYLSVFDEMDFLACALEKDGEQLTWTKVMKIPTLGSLIGIGNHNCYLEDIICLKENESILWRKTDGNFLEYNMQKAKVTEFAVNQIPPATELSILFAGSFASLRIPWD